MSTNTHSALVNVASLYERVGLAAGMRIADLGCGVTGHYIIPAARIVGDSGRAYAVDLQQSALDATESRAKLSGVSNIATIWSDIEHVGATGIPAGSLDVALIASTLHIVKDRTSVLQEAARLVRSGGTILVVEWRTDGTVFRGAVQTRIGPDELREAAAAAQLTEQSFFGVGQFHYGMTFTKA
ncbi:MAG: methyltransferase domain-containing protein [Candidatus Uhrbacteria bacterium]